MYERKRRNTCEHTVSHLRGPIATLVGCKIYWLQWLNKHDTLQNVSAPGNLYAPLWNCCQLTGNQPHQSLQLSNPSLPHSARNHQAATSPEMPGFSSTAWGPVLADLGPTWNNGPVRLRFVWMWQGADCTPHLAWLHQVQTSVPHRWGGQPCYFGIPYLIKVLTNMYSCSCIPVVLKVVDIDPRGQLDHPRGR